jgi:hypothetical protein
MVLRAIRAWWAGDHLPTAQCCRCLGCFIPRERKAHDGWVCRKCFEAGLWLKP